MKASLIFFFTLFSSLSEISIAADTITPNQSISDGQTLISTGESFVLGFFSPNNSNNRYLGIWYYKVSIQTVVWVANREKPIMGFSGVLRIGDQGDIVILNGTSSVIWSSNQTNAVNPVVQLLDSGNLILREEGDENPNNFLWQSFDYPSDTMLPSMKLGWNLKTGLDRFLTSWKSSNDPSVGDYTFKINPNGSPEVFLWHLSSIVQRSGPWNGNHFSGVPEMVPDYLFNYDFVSNQDEVYYRFELINNSVISRLIASPIGEIQRLTWINGSGGTGFWNLFWKSPYDQCDNYAVCGPYGICDTDNSPVCNCLQGFEPKSPQDWYLRVGTGGCVRRTPLDCQKGDGFLRLQNMKLPDTSLSFVDMNMSLRECEDQCFKNCSCMAYSNADVNGGGSGCITWATDLVDLRQYSVDGQDLYVRLAASELSGNAKKRRVAIIVSVTLVSAMILFGIIGNCIWREKKKKKQARNDTGHSKRSKEIPLFDINGSLLTARDKFDESRKEEVELPFYDLATVANATDNFSKENKLGEGGFGPVYRGKLADGQEIAVKRLSRHSQQGPNEFMNEVKLIAKLQHRNLVRLLGWCIRGEERMLIYEYMQNKSLDSIIFDETKRALIDWQKRFNIILGIARGLLYLHQDSRLRIIHRDLKPSNVLLDDKMNPKISDFGMARIFGGDQMEANTNRVVGTYGYMSPEYAMDGHFSEKSDVFSFGVLVIEIVSGQKTRGFFHAEEGLNLLGHAWKLWTEGESMNLMDPSMGVSYSMSEALRCIHVGLLCVQERAEERPTMSSVVLMLGSENPTLPQPKEPGFCKMRSPTETDRSSSWQHSSAANEITNTTLEASWVIFLQYHSFGN
ncbi:G-type lectin S-receptor-like serine/threonine-protein kinase At4g27290 isoform X2 [Tasmannia lanceolata]|uniref:G-type lectin S-receptor-like serine/threonine-protein kinase At4g27290 isoform X2 n=1 Tax=Tasmannia lanceolata TaxID=3420 RepID=UPI0040644774